MKKIILIVFLIGSFFSAKTQAQNANDVIWESLCKNDRKTALKLVNKFKVDKSSMEQLVLKQLVKRESGLYAVEKGFATNFSSKKDYEYFLFALWNEQYIFKDYCKYFCC